MSENQDFEALRRENADLRERLARSEAEAARHRATANDLMDSVFPYIPPTEEELQQLMEPDEGETLEEIVAGFRRKLEGREECRPSDTPCRVLVP
jgi:hypothetical protein